MKKMKAIILSITLLTSLWMGSAVNNKAEAGLMCLPFNQLAGAYIFIGSFSYALLMIGLSGGDFIKEDSFIERISPIIFLGGLFLGEENTSNEGVQNLLIKVAKDKYNLDLDEDTAQELSMISTVSEHQNENSKKAFWISASRSSIENVLTFTDYNHEEQGAIIKMLTANK